MISDSQANIPSLYGWWDTQPTCSTGMPYTQMATQASSEDGIKNTKHHSVSLVKQFFTRCQTQRPFQRWNSALCQEYALAKTQHPMIRRLPAPEKYNKQLLDLINRSPTLPYTTGGPYVSPLVYKKPLRRPATTEPDTQTFGSEATTQQPQLQTQQSEASAGLPPRLAIADSPMATAPTSCHTRSSLPSPKRTVLDEVAEGSLPKQHRTTATPTGPARPDTTTEPPKSKLRITQVTTQTKKGVEITAYTCDDITERQTEKILLEPMVNNTEDFDKQKTIEGMKNEIEPMKKQQVYMEVGINTLTPEQRKHNIQSRWVLRDKGDNVRARIVPKGYTESVNALDDIYASTPMFCILRTLLTIFLNRGWIARTGDISTAFFHAAAATPDW